MKIIKTKKPVQAVDDSIVMMYTIHIDRDDGGDHKGYAAKKGYAAQLTNYPSYPVAGLQFAKLSANKNTVEKLVAKWKEAEPNTRFQFIQVELKPLPV